MVSKNLNLFMFFMLLSAGALIQSGWDDDDEVVVSPRSSSKNSDFGRSRVPTQADIDAMNAQMINQADLASKQAQKAHEADVKSRVSSFQRNQDQAIKAKVTKSEQLKNRTWAQLLKQNWFNYFS